MITRRNFIYLLLIIVTLLLYFGYQGRWGDERIDAVDLMESPIYQSRQARSSFFGIDGRIDHIIDAVDIKHYEYDNRSTFVSPVITFFNSESIENWQISSEEATLIDDHLMLSGVVVIHNLIEDAELNTITTRDVTIDLMSNVATSEHSVLIEGDHLLSTGVGVEAHLTGQTANVLNDVNTRYFVTPSESSTSDAP